MKINPINLTRFKIALVLQFFTEVYDLIMKVGAEQLGIAKQFSGLFVPKLQAIDEAVRKVAKSMITELIWNLDEKRDNAILGMIEVINGFLRHYDEEFVKAAKALLNLFDTYDGITRKPLNEQTALLNNLLRQLMGEYVEHVKKLGLENWVAHLSSVNKELDAAVKKRDDEKAEKCDVVVKNTRVELIDAYKLICGLVNALAAVESESPIYNDFIKRLNVVVARYVTGVRKPAPTDTAKEWTNMVDVGDFKLGDICFVVVDGVKKYYKMIDESNFNVRPNGGEGELGWEPVEL